MPAPPTEGADPEAALSPDASRRQAFLLLALVIVLWGANWPVMKIAVEHYVPPLWFAAVRMVMGAGCLLLALAAMRRIRLPGRADLPILLSIGLGQMAAFMGLVNVALLVVPAGRAAVLAYTTPLWVAPFAALVLGERLTARKLLGLLLGLAGLGVLFNPLGLDWSRREVVIGNGLLLLAALSWAIAILHIRAHRWRLQPVQLAPWQMLLAAVPLTLLAAWLEGPLALEPSPALGAILLYNGPIATAIAYWATVTVTRRLPAVTTSVSFLGVPMAGVLFSALALGEPVTATILASLALIVGGVLLVSLGERT